MDRGNSVYFPSCHPYATGEALQWPVLVEPEVERLAMVCDMDINNSGEIKGYKFYQAVFRSKARLTYNQVWDWLGESVPETDIHRDLQPQVQALYALFKILLKARHKRGAIDFETPRR